jgi:ribosomal protein S18 acetylase RimI-like enzyme
MMAIESEGKHLDEAVLLRGVRRALEDPLRGRYLVAECDNADCDPAESDHSESDTAESDHRVVGQLLVTREWSDWRDGWFWWIQSVYVAKDFRRRGVYRRLYEHLREQARNTPGVCGLRLYVERENEPAIATYESLGMVDAGYHLYEIIWPSDANESA